MVDATDDEVGMAWWNAMSDFGREFWMEKAGNTGVAKDAWEKFKEARASSEGAGAKP